MDEATVERVRAVVAAIPAGRVASYGDVAELARAPSPRLVGRVLAEDGHDLPWHRVIRADGTPAPHLAREQLARLRAEGVLAQGDRIDLRTYRWEEPRPADAQDGLFGEPGKPPLTSGRRGRR
jgi:alkylated DNA nucleotide flippase Atl1